MRTARLPYPVVLPGGSPSGGWVVHRGGVVLPIDTLLHSPMGHGTTDTLPHHVDRMTHTMKTLPSRNFVGEQ